MAGQAFQERTGAEVHQFDLERATSRAALSTPEITLESLRGLVVIDEIQRMPQI